MYLRVIRTREKNWVDKITRDIEDISKTRGKRTGPSIV